MFVAAVAPPTIRRERPPIHSPTCEEFVGSPRGQQGQAVGRGRRGRVRSRHRPGVQRSPGGQPPGLPRRQGAAQGARGPHRPRPGPRAGAARRGAAVPRQGRARARRRPDRHAGDRDHRRRGGGPGRVRRHVRGPPEITRRPATAVCASSCRRSRPTDDEIEEAIDAELRAHGSLVDVDRPVASRRPRHARPRRHPRRRGGRSASTPRTGPYEVGQGWVADDFDEQLIGASVGDELTFTATPEGHRGARPTSPSRSPRCRSCVLPELDRRVGQPRTSASSTPSRSGARRSRERLGDRQAQPGPPGSSIDGRHRGAGRAGRHRAAGSRWSTATCRPRVQNTVRSSSRRRASTSSSGCRPPGRTRSSSSRRCAGSP